MPRAKKEKKSDNENPLVSTGDIPKSDYMKAKCVVIGKNIREHRKQRRFSVDNMAEYLQLSISYIGLLERGDRCPSMKIVFKICDLFGITPDDLLTAKNSGSQSGLMVAEDSPEYNAKMQVDAIVSLLRVLNKNELDFVIDTVKGLRKMR